MSGNRDQSPPCHMVLRLVNNKPVLLTHSQPKTVYKTENKVNWMTRNESQIHCSDRITPLSQHKYINTPSAHQGEPFDPTSIVKWSANGQSLDVENSKKQPVNRQIPQSEHPKVSIINQLTDITDDPKKSMIIHSMPQQLTSLDWVQTNSFNQDQSCSDFDDHQSEVMELTPEERQFFQTFIYEAPTSSEEEISKPFQTLKLTSSVKGHQRTQSYMDNLPADKRNLIRNFFRAKGSMIKDEKTCCNSQVFLQEEGKKGRERPELGSEESCEKLMHF